MNQALLPAREYYRPQRAAELRRKADRVEWRELQVVGVLTATFVMGSPLALLAAWVGLVILEDFHRPPPLLTVALATLGTLEILVIAFGLVCWVRALRSCIQGYRQEASALEAEHHARYGTRNRAALPGAASVKQADE